MAAQGLLLAFDIDGTLVTEPSPTDSPSQRTIDAIRAAAHARAIISLATGREVADAVAFARRHLPDCCTYAIGGNGRETALVSTGEILRSTADDGISLDPLAIAVLNENLRALEPALSFTVGLKKATGGTEYVRDQPHADWAWNKWKDAVPWYRTVVFVDDLRPVLEAVGSSASEYVSVESAFGYRGEDPLVGFNAVWPEFIAASAANRNAVASLNILG